MYLYNFSFHYTHFILYRQYNTQLLYPHLLRMQILLLYEYTLISSNLYFVIVMLLAYKGYIQKGILCHLTNTSLVYVM